MFILSFITSGLEFSSVNHTSIYGNSKLEVFKNIKLLCEISNNWPNNLLRTNVYKTFEFCWYLLLTILQWANATSVIFIVNYLTFSTSKWFLFFRHYKFEIIPCFNSQCNPIFYFIYIYFYWRFISHYFVLLMTYPKCFWISDTEYNPSDNLKFLCYVGDDTLYLLFLYDLFIFFHM